jgi:hypothetical protein
MLTGLPTLATAQSTSCTYLKGEDARLEREIVALLAKYPGTNLLLGGCILAAVAAAESSQTEEGAVVAAMATFSGCAVLACALSGSENCFSVGQTWLGLALQKIEIERQRNKGSCA